MNVRRLLVGLALVLALAGQTSCTNQVESEQLSRLRAQAEQGKAQAQYELGGSFQFGELGLKANHEEGAKWWRKAAEQNHGGAQFNLGVCYGNGEGVAKDEVEAYKWISLAAAQGNEGAKTVVAKLEGTLSREQIAEGKRRADDWLEQHKKSSAGSR